MPECACGLSISTTGSTAGHAIARHRSPESRRALSDSASTQLLIWLIAASVAGLAALISTLVGRLEPQWLVGVLLASGWALIAAGYFVLFWSGAGQTPGMRLLHLRLLGREGRPPSLSWSIVRVFGTAIAIIPLFAGYLPVLFSERRRGLPDFLAGTVVLYEDPPELRADPVHMDGEAVEGVRERAADEGH